MKIKEHTQTIDNEYNLFKESKLHTTLSISKEKTNEDFSRK